MRPSARRDAILSVWGCVVCFSIELIVRIIIFIALIILCIAIFNLWVGDWLASMSPYGAKLALTLKWIFGFIIFCFVLYLLVELVECALGSSYHFGVVR